MLAAAVVLLAGVARAQPAGDPGDREAARPSAPEVDPEARRLFLEGLRRFNVGEYDQAIPLFKSSYLIEPAPGLLYNLAQAHRLKGDCDEALALYRRFLATKPEGQNRQRAEARLVEMQACATRNRAPAPADKVAPEMPMPDPLPVPAAAVAPPATPSLGVALEQTPAPARRPLWRSRLAIGLGAAALGFAAGGVYFGLRADEAADQNTKVFARGQTWDRPARDRESIGRQSQALAITLVGAAVTAAGTAIWLWAYD